MDQQLRQEAVKDLLQYCRNNCHRVKLGTNLAPILIGPTWDGRMDTLAEALAELIEEELARWRRNENVAPIVENETGRSRAEAELLRDLEARDHNSLIFVWAYYINQLPTRRIRDLYPYSLRSIQLKIMAGRRQVAALVERREQASMPCGWGHNQAGSDQVQVASAPMSGSNHAGGYMASQPPEGSTPGVERRPLTEPSWDHDRLAGKRSPVEQRHVGPRVRRVARPQNIHVVHAATVQYVGQTGWDVLPTQVPAGHAQVSPLVKRETDHMTRLLFAMALLFIALSTALLVTWTWLGIALMLAIGVWRTTTHSWRLRQRWSLNDDTGREQTWWQGCYMLAWLGFVGWILVAGHKIQSGALVALQLEERLALLLAFVCTSATVLMLGIFDVLLGVNRAERLSWPWELLRPYARGCWETRWYFVAIGWALLLASALPHLLPAL